MGSRLFHTSAVNAILRRAAPAALVLLVLASCAKPIPILGDVPEFSLTDQTGRTVSKKDLAGSVWIADFIYTGCAAACPLMTQNLSAVGKELPGVRLVSITVDPETDTPERLKQYSDQFGARPETWSFLTGDVETIRKTVSEGFKLSLQKASETDIFHSEKFVLIDKQGRMRGYFDSNALGQAELKTAARRLQKETGTP
ncbi:MAG TPA: SCO family protein [bacterium]|nr:SCO family protein [bacterium]